MKAEHNKKPEREPEHKIKVGDEIEVVVDGRLKKFVVVKINGEDDFVLKRKKRGKR